MPAIAWLTSLTAEPLVALELDVLTVYASVPPKTDAVSLLAQPLYVTVYVGALFP